MILQDKVVLSQLFKEVNWTARLAYWSDIVGMFNYLLLPGNEEACF